MAQRPPGKRPPRPGKRERGSAGTAEQQSRRPTAGPRPSADPRLPDGVSWFDLDFSARRELQGLPKELAERVGGQLAAAGLVIDDDPAAAYSHAACARRLASRVAVTREALGLAAYAVGKFDQALAELRAHRRLSGDDSHLPLVADCERGLGRPERALELASSAAARRLDAAGRRELRLVVAGTRADMDQPDAAVLLLEQDPGLRNDDIDESLVRLRYAYADALLRLDRAQEATEWFSLVNDQDTNEITDSAERLQELANLSEGIGG